MGLLHLFSSRQDKIDIMVEKKITTISYEQIQLPDGSQPVRKPLSEIGGRLVAQIGAHLLQNDAGGKGILLGGMGGVPPAEAVIIGAGVSGTAAARSFLGVGAHVTVLDTNLDALQNIHETFPGVATMVSSPHNVARATSYADIVAACIQIPGERPPIVVTRDMIRGMRPRSLIMDVSIDEGGCVETSRPTTHEHPTFVEEGIIHYCVPNMGSAVARTSTYAFLNAAYTFIKEIAEKGCELAIEENPAIETGAIIYKGELRRLPRMRTGMEEEE
jgi:alanine dehydrogenase